MDPCAACILVSFHQASHILRHFKPSTILSVMRLALGWGHLIWCQEGWMINSIMVYDSMIWLRLWRSPPMSRCSTEWVSSHQHRPIHSTANIYATLLVVLILPNTSIVAPSHWNPLLFHLCTSLQYMIIILYPYMFMMYTVQALPLWTWFS